MKMLRANAAGHFSGSGFRSVPGKPERQYLYHLPASRSGDTPVIVTVHGISRNAAEHMMRLREMAESTGAAIIAPYFSHREYRGYQQLECRTGARADLALRDMLSDFSEFSGIGTNRIKLAGFSGGGQFAHRFAMFHADRVETCVCIAAGWYSWPDRDTPYPLGLGQGRKLAGTPLHPGWEQVPIHVLVGSRDNAPETNLNMNPEIVALQGRGRHIRARRWVKAMRGYRSSPGSAPVTLEIIPHFGHDFGKAVARHNLDGRLALAFGLIGKEEKCCA